MRRLFYLALLIGGTANAAIVTIDPQAYPTGTDLSDVTPGVRIREITNWGVASGFVAQPIYAVPNLFATGIGPNLFGHNNGKPTVTNYDFRYIPGASNCLGGGSCTTTDFYNPLRAMFSVPTNFIEVRVQYPQQALDGADLRAYNTANQLIAICHVPGDIPSPTAQPKYTFPLSMVGVPCGTRIRRYECNSSGVFCKTEYRAFIARAYPEVAYVLWGGESTSSTGAPISLIRFRRFSEDCAP